MYYVYSMYLTIAAQPIAPLGTNKVIDSLIDWLKKQQSMLFMRAEEKYVSVGAD